jgi:hypothetical protein
MRRFRHWIYVVEWGWKKIEILRSGMVFRDVGLGGSSVPCLAAISRDTSNIRLRRCSSGLVVASSFLKHPCKLMRLWLWCLSGTSAVACLGYLSLWSMVLRRLSALKGRCWTISFQRWSHYRLVNSMYNRIPRFYSITTNSITPNTHKRVLI